MKKKIIIGVSALLVVITSIVIYILVILSPYRNIDNLKEYIAKDDAKYEATIEYSSSYDSKYVYPTQDNYFYGTKSYTTLYNRVVTYKFSEDAVVVYHYADFETTDGEYVTNEVSATCFYEKTETEGAEYSCILTGEEKYSSNAIWSKEVLSYGDVIDIYTGYTSMYKYVDHYYSGILSRININYKEVDGIYYEALNGVKIVDNPTTVELKTNKAIITINGETEDSIVITLSKLKTTKVKSPLPDATNDGFIFDYNEDSASYNLIDYTENSKNVEIPETYNDGINGEKVVDTLGSGCFFNTTKMKDITIPSSVTYIASDAFYACSSLESITIPTSVTEIGWRVFYGCSSLESITIPTSVTSIGSYAFAKCSSLESITIPNTITYIDSFAFYGCSNLESLIIQSTAMNTGIDVFDECDSLETFYVSKDITSSLLNTLSKYAEVEYYD